MNKIHILDCTLRDGGYCNQWVFGLDNTIKIAQNLVDANIDIIECGFLTNKVIYNPNVTKFTSIEELSHIIPKERNGKIFVAMMNYGEYEVEKLPDYDASSVEGIRVAFHKKNLKEALEVCWKIKEKGYKVFVQAMVSLSYTDEEFLALIKAVNTIGVYAFYIVDSFGMMKRKNLIRLFYMVENNISEGIWIGFHSHNNMQLAYSNAQSLVDAQTNCNLIIDSSIYGMGRGAGNLNTELFVEYLNETVGTNYSLKPLLNVIDEILIDFYQKNYWGYSLPNYLSAKHWVHPDYAGYLSEKNTLTVDAMDDIFSMMLENKKFQFDKKYIEQLYIQYMTQCTVQDERGAELKERLQGKKVLLIAPGRSTEDNKDIIIDFAIRNDVVVISVNYDYPYIFSDFIFVSNLRRFRELDESKYKKCIVTTNILTDRVYSRTNYYELLSTVEVVKDNAGMMAIKYLINMGVKKAYLAGFDGYSHDIEQNYAYQNMAFTTKNTVIDAMNKGMYEVIKCYKEYIDITFLTESRFV